MQTIILQSKDGRFFRRIDADGGFYQKTLGMPWEKHDPETISEKEKPKYIETLTKKLGWKIAK